MDFLSKLLFSPEPSDSTKNMVEREINDNAIIVFSYCAEARDLLSSLKANHKVIDINTLPNGRDIQNYLKSKTGQSTVPFIFINKDLIGGCDDLIEEYENGNLKKRLSAINQR